uniref:NADH-ubiquinone oxidoreductase chain 1 n=1 Tax=Lepidocyrtus fimetarius TaxID=2583952 RepID=A0A6G8FF51_9HEXA|nr:NADH dehydrogenase subunit 1 [Lepidocyrtus fimetarius]QIM14977.1 NADH dehydrogenase subunit 1 [Lepidocyrtus fimetarius]
MYYFFEILSFFGGYIFMVVGILVSVAFMVLLERKVLGYIQIRKGPNKVGYTGVIQSFSDAVKLFVKESFNAYSSNLFIYYFSPIFSLFVVLVLWAVLPYSSLLVNFIYGGIFFFACTSLGVYVLIGGGWSSNSSYALLGATRGVAQTISYEVSMILIFLSLVFFCKSYNLMVFITNQGFLIFLFMFMPIFMCWVISCLAETNRTPFDFAEGESELVSGFNIEYGSGGFALFFLAEYGSIIFMSYFITSCFFGWFFFSSLMFNFLGVFFCFWFIWVRGTMPRYRYDKLMNLAWKSFLPASLFFLLFYLGVVG